MFYIHKQDGIILIDIILALSLATLFITLITESSMGARDMFRRAHERNELLDIYESHISEVASLLPSQIYVAEGFVARASWYGNDRIQTDIEVTSTTSNQSITFTAIYSYPFVHDSDSQGTSLCDVALISDPRYVSITPIALSVSSLIPLTHLEVRNGIAYVSADSSIASDPDIFVFDIHDLLHTFMMSSVNTGPGIVSFSIAGNRIFAAAASTAAQLHIIRFDGLSNPVLEKKYQIPLPYATATAPFASSIFFNKDALYLGTEKWDGNEFFIVDVSNPTQPQTVESLDIDTKINGITVRGDTVYLATSGLQQLVGIDIRDRSNPHPIYSFSPSGWTRQEGKVISFFEDRLNMGRTSGGFNITQDHELFSWASTTLDGHVDVGGSQSVDMPGGIYGMVTDRNGVYVATRETGKELQIFDTSLSTSTMISYALPVLPQSMTCDGDSIYVLGKGAPVIYKINNVEPI